MGRHEDRDKRSKRQRGRAAGQPENKRTNSSKRNSGRAASIFCARAYIPRSHKDLARGLWTRGVIQPKQRTIVSARYGPRDPSTKLLVGNYSLANLSQHDPADQHLPPHLRLPFTLRRDRFLPSLRALLLQLQLLELLLERRDLFVEFGHDRPARICC